MNRFITPILILCLSLATGFFSSAYAWNRATHMVTGAIAYRDLMATSPQTASRVISILKQHPDYQPRWASKLNDPSLSASERNEYLFILAARWPDDIKSGNKCPFSPLRTAL